MQKILHGFVLCDNCTAINLCTMPVPAIDRWLNNPARDYSSGFALYQRYGKSRFLLDLLGQGEDEYNSQRLLVELKNLNSTDFGSSVGTSVPPVTPPREVPSGVFSSLDSYTRFSPPQRAPIDTNSLPESLQQLVVEKSALYKKCCSLHQRLEYMPSDKERAVAAQTICDHFRRMDEIWQQLDYYQAHKIVRPKHGRDLSALSITVLIKRRNTLRTYVSRLRKAPESAQYIQYSAELDAIQRMIDLREEEDA